MELKHNTWICYESVREVNKQFYEKSNTNFAFKKKHFPMFIISTIAWIKLTLRDADKPTCTSFEPTWSEDWWRKGRHSSRTQSKKKPLSWVKVISSFLLWTHHDRSNRQNGLQITPNPYQVHQPRRGCPLRFRHEPVVAGQLDELVHLRDQLVVDLLFGLGPCVLKNGPTL